jgi:hypothetical protein
MPAEEEVEEVEVIVTIYGPPSDDLPWLVVAIYPDGHVIGNAADSEGAAETMADELATKVANEDS